MRTYKENSTVRKTFISFIMMLCYLSITYVYILSNIWSGQPVQGVSHYFKHVRAIVFYEDV